jgi:succinoglycan biosynthesis protein ExoO
MTGEHDAIPDVSIVIAGWNAEAWIGRAVSAALGQTGGIALEVIVVDDASRDNTLEAARAAANGDPRLACVRLAHNSGPSGARNHGFARANGRFIAVLDADDAMRPGRLAHMVARAETAGADLVLDNMIKVSAPGDDVEDGLFLDQPAAQSEQVLSLAAYLDPHTGTRLGGAPGYLKPVFRTETLRRLGLAYDETLRNSEDFYLAAELIAQGGRAIYTPLAGYLYTVRTDSISHRLTLEQVRAIEAAEARFLARHNGGFDGATRRAARARAAWLHRTAAFEQLAQSLKQRRPGDVFASLARHPGEVPHMMGRLVAIGLNKLRAPEQRKMRGV